MFASWFIYVAPPFTNQGWGVEEEAERGSRRGQAWTGDREGLCRCSLAPGRTRWGLIL